MQCCTIFGSQASASSNGSFSVKPVIYFYLIEKSVGWKIKGYLLM